MVKGVEQVLRGLLMAVMFTVLLLGSFSMALAERGWEVAQVFTSTPTYTTPDSVFATLFAGGVISTRANTPTPTPTFTPPADCPPPPGWVAYEILPGDTLSNLAGQYQLNKDDLAAKNCMTVVTNTLQPGSVIYLPQQPPVQPSPRPTRTPVRCSAPPAGWVVYTVRSGDTLYALGLAVGVSTAQIQAANCMGNSTAIITGKRLYLPHLPPAPTVRPTKTPVIATAPPTVPSTVPPTVPPPTFLPQDTPTPTESVVATTVVPPTDTLPPPGSGTPGLLVTETPITPPSNTPVTPPTNTPVTPPPDTPAPPPTSAPVQPPPTKTPVPPPSSTPVPTAYPGQVLGRLVLE